MSLQLVGPTSSMGELLDFRLNPPHTKSYCEKFIFPGLNKIDFMRQFQKDILINSFVETFRDLDIYYITSICGGEELYYFRRGNKLFHGETVWSDYHSSFLPYLENIQPSEEVADDSLFIGSKNNYTHQLIDCLPNLLWFGKWLQNDYFNSATQVYGSPNSILDSINEIPQVMLYRNQKKSLNLASLGQSVSVLGWNIKCIRFKKIHLVKHLSIFESFSLVKECFDTLRLNSNDNYCESNKYITFLARSDDRIKNQKDIIHYLNNIPNTRVVQNIEKLSYAQKKNLISKSDSVILPPGSDNINGLCFTCDNTKLVQMISTSSSQLLGNPFTSLAGIRYLLPFMHRTRLFESFKTYHAEMYAGMWDVSQLMRDLLPQ